MEKKISKIKILASAIFAFAF
ncbi:MAG: hypothetical protein UY42_C0036G0001, partial [Parcubacteria group bacterium GW2011_GWA2_49_16]